MKLYWQNFCDWFNARNERERILIIVVTVVTVVSLWTVLISDPLNLQKEQLKNQHANILNQKKALQIQINAIIARSENDPNKLNKVKITELQAAIKTINASLQQKMRGFVDPGRMAGLLEDVLKQKTKLKLVRLESLPAEYIFADTKSGQEELEEKEEVSNAGLYRHGFKMELQGSYLHTLDYLKALEELPWDFYWNAIDIEIIKYPQAKIILKLHTLSLKETWIGV